MLWRVVACFDAQRKLFARIGVFPVWVWLDDNRNLVGLWLSLAVQTIQDALDYPHDVEDLNLHFTLAGPAGHLFGLSEGNVTSGWVLSNDSHIGYRVVLRKAPVTRRRLEDDLEYIARPSFLRRS